MGLDLRIKFSGVPANNNEMNLPDEERQKPVVIRIEKASNGQVFYEEKVDFIYQGEAVWQVSINTNISLDEFRYRQGGFLNRDNALTGDDGC